MEVASLSFVAKIGAGFRRTGAFFSDSVKELKKVRWPNRKEMSSYTIVVIGTVVFLTLFFYLTDWVFSNLLQLILK